MSLLILNCNQFLNRLRIQLNNSSDRVAHISSYLLKSHAANKEQFQNLSISYLIQRHTITVSCLPEDLPEFIEVDIRNLGVGNSVHVKNLPQLKGVTYKTSADDVVVSCVSLAEDDGATDTAEEASKSEGESEESKK